MPDTTWELTHWITERYAIKLRRAAGILPPWTADPHMEHVRYCNVHREDDAVTKWFRAYWNKPDDPAWKFVLGRMINYVPTLEEIRLPTATDNLDEIKSVLKARRSRGEKVFTSVYTISTCGKSMNKIDYVVDHVCESVFTFGLEFSWKYDSLASMQSDLTCIDGLGSFLAAQVIADMKNTAHHPLAKAPDYWDWCAPGPGSIKGLKAFFPGRNVTAGNFHTIMKECRQLVDPLIPDYIPRISAQDFQNCLCEFSKYMRVKYENGHVRNRYVASV